jgi:hypothetical protein
MTGNDLSREIARQAFIVAVLIFGSGIAAGLLARWLWPVVKAFIHWVTGDRQ